MEKLAILKGTKTPNPTSDPNPEDDNGTLVDCNGHRLEPDTASADRRSREEKAEQELERQQVRVRL